MTGDISSHAQLLCCHGIASNERRHSQRPDHALRNWHHLLQMNCTSASVFSFWSARLVWHLQHAHSPTVQVIETWHCNNTRATAAHYTTLCPTTAITTTSNSLVTRSQKNEPFQYAEQIFLCPSRGVEHCDEFVCLSHWLCLSTDNNNTARAAALVLINQTSALHQVFCTCRLAEIFCNT